MVPAVSLQAINKLLEPEKLAQALVFFLLATLPLIFGAVHPIVQGTYTFLILVGFGGWLLYVLPEFPGKAWSWYWVGVPLVLIVYIILQSLPLPLSLVELLSPERATRIGMVNTLAQTNLASTSISDNGITGLREAFFVFSLLLYYIVLVTLLRRNKNMVSGLLYVIAGVGLFEGMYGLLQVMNPHMGILWLPVTSKGAAHGSIIYKNQYASLLNMCWPLALAGGILFLDSLKNPAEKKARKGAIRTFFWSLSQLNIQIPLFFFSAGIMILAVVFSFSRGGILTMLLLICFLNIFMPCSRKIKLLLTLLLIFFLGGYGSLLGIDGVITRFSTIDNSGLNRLNIYLSSLPMFLDHWLTGIGLGSFKLLSGVYLKGFPENILFDRVHNDYIELAIEIGLPMALLFLTWLLSGILITGKKLVQKKRIIHQECRTSILVGSAAFCSLLGFLIHGLVDFGWRLPANAVYAVTLLALISYALHDSPLPAKD
ncbi:MAG: O-antigen ligase family protein [Pseudomonadota bacterium]